MCVCRLLASIKNESGSEEEKRLKRARWFRLLPLACFHIETTRSGSYTETRRQRQAACGETKADHAPVAQLWSARSGNGGRLARNSQGDHRPQAGDGGVAEG